MSRDDSAAPALQNAVGKPEESRAWTLIMLAIQLPIFFWFVAKPDVTVHYSEQGPGTLRYISNVQHSIHRGQLEPGQATGDSGDIFPDADFFMRFDWWFEGGSHCVQINPQWPQTDIYIDANGELDRRPESGTDLDRLSPCAD